MNKKVISSAQNSIMKQIRELQKKKNLRKNEQAFIVEGIRGIKELPTEACIKTLVTTDDVTLESLGSPEAQQWIEVTKEVYKTLSETQSPQGALAVVKMPLHDLQSYEMAEGNYLLLENLQDPGNLGTIIRTAHAFDFKAVFLTKGCVEVFSPKVVRSTMSALFHIPVFVDYEAAEYLELCKAQGATIFTTALTPEAKPIYSIDFPAKSVIVIGNEGNGVTDYMLSQTDHTMIIPMPGAAESLNASIAASICMYEVNRQKA